MKPTSINNLEEEGETIKGEWQLDRNHELAYRERKGKTKVVRLKGTLVAAEAGTLVFSAEAKEAGGKTLTGIYKLTGDWRVDAQNRITFEVEKESGQKDKLVFSGSWEIGPNHEIIYSYQRSLRRTKKETSVTETQTLTFNGHWDLSERHRLAFLIEGDTGSALRFRGAFQTKSILAREGEIRYQVGVEIEGRPQTRTLVLFGKWKFSRELELSFEIEYAEGGKRALVFGGTYRFDDQTGITVELKSRDGGPLGAEVVFTREFFGKDGRLFVRLRKSIEESNLEAGVKFTW